VVNVKLKYYAEDLKRRQEVAQKYTDLLKINNQKLKTPIVKDDRTSTFAQYSIRVQNRDDIQKKLSTLNQLKTKNQKPKTNIPTAVHYPMPLHLQECFFYLGHHQGDFSVAEKVSSEIMSLPMNPYITDNEITYITESVIDANKH